MHTPLQQQFDVSPGEVSPDELFPGQTLPLDANILGRLRRRTAGTANTALLAIAFVFVAGLLALLGMRFPEAMSLLMANQKEIRQLQEQNADLRKRRDKRVDRLKRLNENPQEQKLEIQRQYNLYPKDTKVFVLPPSQKSEAAGEANPALPNSHAAPQNGTKPGTP